MLVYMLMLIMLLLIGTWAVKTMINAVKKDVFLLAVLQLFIFI